MKHPKLRKKTEKKNLHGFDWEDQYSWIHQKNILEFLQDSSKLKPEVKKYLEEENKFTEFHLNNTKKTQKILFREIKGRIKLDDTSLPFQDKFYEYWTETSKKGNYFKKLRKKIGSSKKEIIWDGDKEKRKTGSNFFSLGSLKVSWNDRYLGYSIDTLGSEYYSIYIRSISSNKLITQEIKETSGSISFSLDDKFIFYSKLDKNHRPKKIYMHELGKSTKSDRLIFEEKDQRYNVGILGYTSDEKFFLIESSDHITSEIYYFSSNEKKPKPKLFKKRKKDVNYSLDSWNQKFYIRTNEKAEDFKISFCNHDNIKKWKDLIPAKDGVIVGGITLLNNWMIRGQVENALYKIYYKNLKTGIEKELILSKEKVYSGGISLLKKDRNTDEIYIYYETPITPERVYHYKLKTGKKRLVKEQDIPSGHNPNNYIVERIECNSHDGEKVPITIVRHKKSKLDHNTKLLLYGYGSYGSSVGTGFSSAKLSLIDRDIIWATAHIRGGMERGMKWWKKGKMLHKKNTFKDYISVANHLISKRYTAKGNLIGLGGSAGGLLLGAVINQAPELFLGVILAVPFVDSLTTNLDHSLPLTIGEFNEFGNAKKYKKHFKYIQKMRYPHILITTSLSDNRVLFDEPTKFIAKLRDYKTDDNLLLLKTEMEAGHGGKSGRDGHIEDIALDYAFALKISEKLEV